MNASGLRTNHLFEDLLFKVGPSKASPWWFSVLFLKPSMQNGFSNLPGFLGSPQAFEISLCEWSLGIVISNRDHTILWH